MVQGNVTVINQTSLLFIYALHFTGVINHCLLDCLSDAIVKSLFVSPRELEARVGATPPPSPSDRTDSAILTSRITQLSKEVKTLRKRLAEVEAKSEAVCYVSLCAGCVRGVAVDLTFVTLTRYQMPKCWVCTG